MDQYDNRQLLIEALKSLPQEDITNLLHEVNGNKSRWSATHCENNKIDEQ